MSIKIGQFSIIPLKPGYIEGADFWIVNNETGEAMGMSTEDLVEGVELVWDEYF